MLVVCLGHKIFHPVAVLFLSSRIEDAVRKKAVHLCRVARADVDVTVELLN